MSDAPLYHALTALAAREGVSRFHMPGHKGRATGSAFDGVFPLDMTELPHTGNLYEGDGPIARAEALAARWYGMDGCFFLTCGATQGLKAALRFFCPRPGDAVVLDRNCHKSVLDGCALLDLRPTYVYPAFLAREGVSGDISPDALRSALLQSGARAAVVTSPTYYGHCLPVGKLAEAAHACGARLIVDAAHGSHLRACGLPDPAAQGADAVIFSAHKTLCALGQGAFLVFRGLSGPEKGRLRAATALFGTTSPSYVVMASLDAARARMEDTAGRWQSLARRAASLRKSIGALTPFAVFDGGDPCRLTVRTGSAGLSGFQAAQGLFSLGVDPEMWDESHVVFILTERDEEADFQRLQSALITLAQRCGVSSPSPAPLEPPRLVPAMTPHAALFAPKIPRMLGQCAGQIAGENLAPYPPGVAAAVQGEVLTNFFIEYLLQKGYNEDTYIHIIPQ